MIAAGHRARGLRVLGWHGQPSWIQDKTGGKYVCVRAHVYVTYSASMCVCVCMGQYGWEVCQMKDTESRWLVGALWTPRLVFPYLCALFSLDFFISSITNYTSLFTQFNTTLTLAENIHMEHFFLLYIIISDWLKAQYLHFSCSDIALKKRTDAAWLTTFCTVWIQVYMQSSIR